MGAAYDAIVVGAGYVGCSVAYHLCRAGLKTALIEQGWMAAGASRANYGNIQIQDMELDKSQAMVQKARLRFATLEEELGRKVGLRRIGGLLTIDSDTQWQMMEKRLAILKAAGIPSELVPASRLREVEPLIDSSVLLGGLYHPYEGQVDPFQFIWAFLVRARSLGLEEHYHTPVTRLEVQGDRVIGVNTPAGKFSAGTVVLCSGAYTAQLGRALGRNWDIHYVLGQALATEPVELKLRNHIASAFFFELAEGVDPAAVRANLAISQSPHGHILLGEAMYEADHFQRHVPFDSLPSISSCVVKYFPAFSKLRIIRSWSAPVAHTSDSCPLLGPVHGLAGLLLAVAFRSTVIVAPLAGETIAQLITTGTSELDITSFLPERN